MTIPTTTPAPTSPDAGALSGLVAILRGVTPPAVRGIAEAVMEEGFAGVEVPLNSPDALASVEILAGALGDAGLIGAGTVLDVASARAAADAGARVILAPDAHPAVIEAAVECGVLVVPGVATPTEAFAALRAGAHALKLFPAGLIGIAGMQAWRAVLPSGVPLVPVGGVDANTAGAWRAAGAGAAGIGSQLYRPGDDVAAVRPRARAIVRAWNAAV